MKLPATLQPGNPPPASSWYRQTVDMLRNLSQRVRALEAKRIDQRRVVADPTPRTFFATARGADVVVSAGVLANIIVAETTLSELADGHTVWIKVEVDEDGIPVAVTVEGGSTLPADDETYGHTVIATVSVAEGLVSVLPLAWNYSQVQKCGATTYLWGGFGGE